jgi:hypothetical protein
VLREVYRGDVEEDRGEPFVGEHARVKGLDEGADARGGVEVRQGG